VYTNFIKEQIKKTLQNLKDFNNNTNKGIKKSPKEDTKDTELLMSVMKIISQTRNVDGKAELVVKRLKYMFNLLKKHGVPTEEDYHNVIDNVFQTYYETKNKVYDLKGEILDLQNKESEALSARLRQFVQEVYQFRQDFLKNLPFTYDEKMEISDINRCYDKISQTYIDLCKIEKEAKEYNVMEELFELEQTQHKALKDCRTDLKLLKQMWDAIAMVTYQYNDWKGKGWKSIKTELMLDSNKILTAQIKALPKEIRQFKGYPVISDKVKNMQILLPLI
jgi:dynein heavy chain